MRNALYRGINSLLILLKRSLYPCECIILFLKVYTWKIIIYIIYSLLGRVFFFCQFDTAMVIWSKETSIEKMPPSDLLVGKSADHFLVMIYVEGPRPLPAVPSLGRLSSVGCTR